MNAGTRSVDRLRWAVLRGLLATVGRTSKGMRVGRRHGFDSGTMQDYVYVNEPHGSLGIGRLIDRACLNAVGWRAVRARGRLLKRTLRAEIDRRPDRHPVRILDVAAGPGRYLQDVLAGYPAERVHAVCRDTAALGLAQGRALARHRGLDSIVYQRGNAFDPQPPEPGAAPDLVVVSGLYELVPDDEAVRASMGRLRGLLAPGGALVFTTRTHQPHHDLIARGLPHRDGEQPLPHCRAVAEAEGWARDAGFADIATDHEDVGLFAVTTARVA